MFTHDSIGDDLEFQLRPECDFETMSTWASVWVRFVSTAISGNLTLSSSAVK